ncbi:MAG: ATPase, T2SS/T4P/T4SS family, partial [Phycisphaeraceae bacterium]|nr:ATPase, T2SS/T4P/T4SS family [Phycisphaeraceae bacterium]
MSEEQSKRQAKGERQLREELSESLHKELLATSRSGEDQPVDAARLTELLLEDCVREAVSDIHIDPQSDGVLIRFRVDGQLLDALLLTRDEGERLINHLKTLGEIDPVHAFTPCEARWSYDLDGTDLDVRLTSTPALAGEKLTLRVLHPEHVTYRIEDLGLASVEHERVQRWLENLSGMFAVSGPTATGKTTTLYALLQELRQRDRSIITSEDPVEYQVDGAVQVPVDEEHDLTFARGLRTMLRLDPDFMLLGEVRDSESARTAVDAAVSGRVMMTSMHSRDAVGVVTALRNWGLRRHEIAAALSLVMSQRLVRKLCPNCR